MEQHFAVIGNPVGHSLSPIMHEAGYAQTGLAAHYQRFQVEEGDLRQAVNGLKALGFTGWNVTVPYKEKIIPFLDELTPEARLTGAVNTVKVLNGRLVGHNTDGAGFVRSIQQVLPDLTGKKAVILGAGGAARGIALSLAKAGMEILILNRTPERAQALAVELQAQNTRADWGEMQAGKWLQEADLVVQTTSVGLHDEVLPLSLQGIASEALVVDIIFSPAETPFLCEARNLGCRTLNGLGMLLHQGALAWEFWLGTPAPLAAMEEALYNG